MLPVLFQILANQTQPRGDVERTNLQDEPFSTLDLIANRPTNGGQDEPQARRNLLRQPCELSAAIGILQLVQTVDHQNRS